MYGTIDDKALDDNIDHMKIPWHLPAPVEHLFKQIKQGHKFVDDGSNPLSERQIVRITYNLINDTGRFALSTHDWRSKVAANQTWPHFQVFFTATYTNLQLSDTTAQLASTSLQITPPHTTTGALS
jgi:hypothetical protein